MQTPIMDATARIPYVRWAGVTFTPPHSVSPPRRIYDHEITYILSGEGFLQLDGREHLIERDGCFFTVPRVAHSFHNDSAEPWVNLGVHFDWEIAPDVARFPNFRADDGRTPRDETLFRTAREISGWNFDAQPILDLGGRPLARHFLEECQTAFARGDGVSRVQSGALLLAAMCQIEREVALMSDRTLARSVGPDAQRRLAEARALLEQIGPETLSIAQIAARVGWSADHFAFMARSAWGISPRRLQSDARLRFARKLLGEGIAVAAVAEQCGFADASHLARAFRKDSGLSPREYSALAARK